MGLFGKSRKDIALYQKEYFEFQIEDVFTMPGGGTLVTGYVARGMCRVGEKAHIYRKSGEILETAIISVEIPPKTRRPNQCGYKTEHIGIRLRGISKDQVEKGDRIIINNAHRQ